MSVSTIETEAGGVAIFVLLTHATSLVWQIDAWGVHYSCYGLSALSDQIGFLMIWPVVAIACTPLVGLILALFMKQTDPRSLVKHALRRGERGLVDAVLLRYAVPLSLLVLFVAFPPVTALAFRAFESCERFDGGFDDDESYLVSYSKHYAMLCPSTELDDAQAVAWGAIFLYPIGTIVLSAFLLYKGRTALLFSETSTPYTRAISFLHSSFTPHYFYFDVLEMIKKLVLVGFASLFSPGSLEQIVTAIIVALLFLVLHLQSTPYKEPIDNVLATASHLSLVMFFVWCTLLQTGALGDPEDDSSLSGSGSVISVVMLLSAVGTLITAVLLYALEVGTRTATEVYQAKLRARWAGHTVDPPTTSWHAEKGYACFLSHYKAESGMPVPCMCSCLAPYCCCSSLAASFSCFSSSSACPPPVHGSLRRALYARHDGKDAPLPRLPRLCQSRRPAPAHLQRRR